VDSYPTLSTDDDIYSFSACRATFYYESIIFFFFLLYYGKYLCFPLTLSSIRLGCCNGRGYTSAHTFNFVFAVATVFLNPFVSRPARPCWLTRCKSCSPTTHPISHGFLLCVRTLPLRRYVRVGTLYQGTTYANRRRVYLCQLHFVGGGVQAHATP